MQLSLTEERLKNLEEPEALRCIVDTVSDGVLYDLTFHASFAVKVFEVMRREGPALQGFDRMQQSFQESVKQLRTLLSCVTDCALERYLAPASESQAALMRLIRDLATYKNWTLEPTND